MLVDLCQFTAVTGGRLQLLSIDKAAHIINPQHMLIEGYNTCLVCVCVCVSVCLCVCVCYLISRFLYKSYLLLVDEGQTF